MSLEHKEEEIEVVENTPRREFLIKAAYTAPVVVALGALAKPTESKAGYRHPPSGPSWT